MYFIYQHLIINPGPTTVILSTYHVLNNILYYHITHSVTYHNSTISNHKESEIPGHFSYISRNAACDVIFPKMADIQTDKRTDRPQDTRRDRQTDSDKWTRYTNLTGRLTGRQTAN